MSQMSFLTLAQKKKLEMRKIIRRDETSDTMGEIISGNNPLLSRATNREEEERDTLNAQDTPSSAMVWTLRSGNGRSHL